MSGTPPRDVIEPRLELVSSQARTLFCQPALTRNPHSGSQAWNFEKKSKNWQNSRVNCQKNGRLRRPINNFKKYFYILYFVRIKSKSKKCEGGL